MNDYRFELSGVTLSALPSGALFLPGQSLLAVSDLHLGKSERMARRGGALLPPYEVQDTLTRLETDIERTGARTVLCLGDTFDDLAASESLGDREALWLARLMAGRAWIWVEGNHDPGPTRFGGSHLGEFHTAPLVFRHIAQPGATGEISGHYHPKARVAGITRRCFLVDEARVILPAFGTYTGGLAPTDRAFAGLMAPDARAVLTGTVSRPVPLGCL